MSGRVRKGCTDSASASAWHVAAGVLQGAATCRPKVFGLHGAYCVGGGGNTVVGAARDAPTVCQAEVAGIRTVVEAGAAAAAAAAAACVMQLQWRSGLLAPVRFTETLASEVPEPGRAWRS